VSAPNAGASTADHGFHENELRLDLLGLGGRGYKSSRIYRVVGDAIGNGARVRVKATGQLGVVQGMVRTPDGPRYLVLHDIDQSKQPSNGEKWPSRTGQNYAPEELDFLYTVRIGGWPEQYPEWLVNATGASLFTDFVTASSSTDRS